MASLLLRKRIDCICAWAPEDLSALQILDSSLGDVSWSAGDDAFVLSPTWRPFNEEPKENRRTFTLFDPRSGKTRTVVAPLDEHTGAKTVYSRTPAGWIRGELDQPNPPNTKRLYFTSHQGDTTLLYISDSVEHFIGPVRTSPSGQRIAFFTGAPNEGSKIVIVEVEQ